MAEEERLTYTVSLEGLPEGTQQILDAGRVLDDANKKQEDAIKMLNTLRMGIRDINAARLAVDQLARGFRTANPAMFMYALLNIVQVITTTTMLMKTLQTQAALTGSALAIVQFLQGPQGWALIAGAIVAAGLVFSTANASMEKGGPIRETGWKYLHEGEFVVPKSSVTYASTYNNLGPFMMTVNVNEALTSPETYMTQWGKTLLRDIHSRGGA